MKKISIFSILIVLFFQCEQNTSEESPPPCQYSTDCNDGNSCTIDTCQGGLCVYKKLKPECCTSDGECQNNQYCDANGECVCLSDGCGGSCGDCPEDYYCKDNRCVGCKETCGECQKCDPIKGYCVNLPDNTCDDCVNGYCLSGACVALKGCQKCDPQTGKKYDLPETWKITDSFSFGDDTSSHNYHATSCVKVSSEKQCPNNKGIIFNTPSCNCWVELDLKVSPKARELKLGVKLGKDFPYSYADCRVYLNDINSSEGYVFSAKSSCNLKEVEVSLNTNDRKNAIKDNLINVSVCCSSWFWEPYSAPLSYIQIQSLVCEE